MKKYNVLVMAGCEEILAAGLKNIAARKNIDKVIYEDMYPGLSKTEIKEKLDHDFMIVKVDFSTFKDIRNGKKTTL